ncbi:Crp/Fnr family transcriptional regulator [Streptomyces sp. NPDC021224]|uniref:Crp/Fnr family transcriptional regulator n=1 Tax=unclassified Streptomyces TaxID=2593676 RepID=UPI0037A80EB2
MRTRRGAGGGQWAEGTLLAEMGTLGPGAAGSALEVLERLGTERVYTRGETMIMAGARDSFVLLLLDGFAKVKAVDASGLGVLVDVRAAGDVVGEVAAFDGGPRTATVSAAQQMYARRISRDDWLRWITGNPGAELAVNRSLAHRSRTAVRRRTELLRGPVVARLARAVLDLGSQYGTRVPEGLLVRPGLTQPEWAELIGARERRVHHALHALSMAEALSYGRCRITIRSVPELLRFAALNGDDW